MGGSGEAKDVDERVATITSMLESVTSEYDKEKL